MKRFYCTICRKVKRVRNIPANTVTPNAEDIYQREGTCNRHSLEYRIERAVQARISNPKYKVTVTATETPAKNKRRA